MAITLRLDPEVQNIAVALGIAKLTAGEVVLDENFFTTPWVRLGSIFSNLTQRAALVSALDALLRRAEPVLLEAVGATSLRSAFPLIEAGKPGQVYIVITRDGPTAGEPMRLSVVAEIQAANAGPGVLGEVVLLRADGSHLEPVAGSPDYPLRIELSAPLSAQGAHLVAALKIVAPPDEALSRLTVRVDGLESESGPIEFDLSSANPPLAKLATLLLNVLLAQVDRQAPDPVRHVAAALPDLLGLAADVPPLPLQELADDPDAMQRWLAQLITTQSRQGGSALVRWFEAIGRMLGAQPLGSPLPRGDASDPAVLTLVAAGPSTPSIALTAGVRTDPVDGSKVLNIGVRVSLVSPSVDAAIDADAKLLSVPLAGNTPAQVLEQFDVYIRAPAKTATLVPLASTGDSIGVGTLRAGLRLNTIGSSPRVQPTLELDDVTVRIASHTTHFAHLDFSDVGTLTGAAQTAVSNAIEAGLGTGEAIVEALRTLLGLGTTPALDVTMFASAPTRAIAGYYRALRTRSGGWTPIVQAVGRLLGNGPTVLVRGEGRRDDPWTIDLERFAALPGTPFGLQLAVWDAGDVNMPRLVLALQISASDVAWNARVGVRVLEVELPATGSGAIQWLGGIDAHGRIDSPTLQPEIEGLSVRARALRIDAQWTPGLPISVRARIETLTLTSDDTTVELGSLRWPLVTGPSLDQADLGLGLDPEALWEALRLLLARSAESWGGPELQALLALIGIVSPRVALPAIRPLRNAAGPDLGAALRAPLELLRSWVAAQLLDDDAVADLGQPAFLGVLQVAQSILTNRRTVSGPTAAAVDGLGTIDEPWTLALNSEGNAGVALTVWAEPHGVPLGWALSPLHRLTEARLTANDLLANAAALSRHAPWLAAALRGRDLAQAARQLDTLAAALANSDGLLPIELATPILPTWVLGTAVPAAHHRITRHPQAISQVRTQIDRWVAEWRPEPWAVLLLGPQLAGADCWSVLLEDVSAADQAKINLRVPGIPPTLVDLSTVTPASWYVIDLADEGGLSRLDASVALGRVVTAVQRARPNAKVVLVAHSYLGLVAEACAAARSDVVAGLITLAAPLGAGDPVVIADPAIAEALRLSRGLAPNGLGSGPPELHDALLLQAAFLEGYHQPSRDFPARPSRLPSSVWQRSADIPRPTLSTTRLLAIPALIEAGLYEALGSAIASDFGGVASASPTQLCWGVQVMLGLPPPAPGEARVDAYLGLKLGEIDLASATSSTAPAWIEFRARISRPNGWLVGSAGNGNPQDARIRWAELVGLVVPGSPHPRVELALRLHDIALRGSAAATIDFNDPRTPELLDTLVQTLDGALITGGHLDVFLDVLVDIGLIRRRTADVPAGILVDGLRALRTDAAAWLGTRLPALLERPSGWFGLQHVSGALPNGGPWYLRFGNLPVECMVEREPWRITVRTTGTGLPIGVVGRLQASGTVALHDAQPKVSGTLRLAGLSLSCEGPGAPLMLTGTWLDQPLSLYPADPDVVGAALASQVPLVLVNAAVTLLLEQALDGSIRVASLEGLLRHPGPWLASTLSDTVNGPLKADRVNALLAAVARLAGLPTSTSQPLQLPGGFAVFARDLTGGTAPATRLVLDSATPIVLGNVDGVDATLDIDLQIDTNATREARPGGQLVLRLPLPAGAIWRAIELRMGADPSGLRFVVSTGSGVNLMLLPSVSGLDTVVSAVGQQLLPEVLDRIVDELNRSVSRPAALDDVLAVATAMGIHDGTASIGAGFRARATKLTSFVADLARGQLRNLAPHVSLATVTLLQRLFGVNLVPTPSSPGRVGLQLARVLGGALDIEADFSSNPVGVHLGARGLELGAVATDLDVGIVAARVVTTIDLKAKIDTGAGLVLTPRLSAGLAIAGGTPRLAVQFRPLDTDAVAIDLAPTPRTPTQEQLLTLANAWLIPLAGTLLLRAANSVLTEPLWNGASKTIADLLVSTNLVTRSNSGVLAVKTPLPQPLEILRGILDVLDGTEIRLPSQFTLGVLRDANRYGIALRGAQRFDIGEYVLTLHLGLPSKLDTSWGDAGRNVGLLLLDLTNSTQPTLTPVLRLGGLGAKLGRRDIATPLVDAGGFRLGAVGAYVNADVTLTGPGALSRSSNIYGAMELDGLGLVIAPGDTSNNPVAVALIQPSGGGDQAPANPPFGLLVATSPSGFAVRFSGEPRLRVPVRRSFGPLHIEEIDLRYQPEPSPGAIGIGIDASISLAGLQVQADDLGLFVPLDAPGNLSRWKVDLAGLSVTCATSSVSISGGLLKAEVNGSIEYRGALAVEVAGRSLSALAAYAQPRDNLGSYASLFAFLAISAPLGGPPYLFVTGVAGGIGLNRRLLTPRDPVAVPSFPLVQAMDGPGTADPMQQLARIGSDIPPSRGAFWLAAGVRFSTFELLRTTALLTLSLDRGFEVSLLGLMRLRYPPVEQATIISLELALAAKYSTVDQVLSVQAALTSNSWLVSRDCQLTGGFAFVAWFRKPEVLLTVGGYSRHFQVPDYYPSVPRVGFHWNVGGGIVVKGEQFFALTHSAAMVGGALEVSYHQAPVRAWLSADLDVVVRWDPFSYEARAHVEVGAEIKVEGNFLGIQISPPPLKVNVVAWLELQGPPLRATAFVDLGVTTISISFGQRHVQEFLAWEEVRDKYIGIGSATTIVAGAVAAKTQSDGTAAAPWLMSPQFVLRIESKMPASEWRLGSRGNRPSFAPPAVDVVPAGPKINGRVRGVLNIQIERHAGPSNWEPVNADDLDLVATEGHFPGAVWDGAILQQDHNGRETIDTSRSMLRALSAVEVRGSENATESTGLMADIPVSKMVEEERAHALPFGPGVMPASIPARRRKPAVLKRIRRIGRVAPAAPTLRVTLIAPTARHRQALSALDLRVKAMAAKPRGGHRLPPGGAQIWEVAVEQAHQLKVRGAPRRMVGLSGAGVVLCDLEATGRGRRVPMGVRTVVLSDVRTDRPKGWELATPLVQASSGTFIAPGASVLLPRPWSASGYERKMPYTWVSAAELTAELDGITTLFRIAPRLTPTIIVIQLDRRKPRANPARVVVDARGAELGQRTIVRQGDRVELAIPVVRLEQHAAGLAITVHCGERWRLAGVLGLRGSAKRVIKHLPARPHIGLSKVPHHMDTRTSLVSLHPLLPSRRK